MGEGKAQCHTANATQLTPVVNFRFINHVTVLSSSKAAREGLDGGELGEGLRVTAHRRC